MFLSSRRGDGQRPNNTSCAICLYIDEMIRFSFQRLSSFAWLLIFNDGEKRSAEFVKGKMRLLYDSPMYILHRPHQSSVMRTTLQSRCRNENATGPVRGR